MITQSPCYPCPAMPETGRQGLEGPTERLSGWKEGSTQGKWGVGDSASDKKIFCE